jgi:hypothetical protein
MLVHVLLNCGIKLARYDVKFVYGIAKNLNDKIGLTDAQRLVVEKWAKVYSRQLKKKRFVIPSDIAWESRARKFDSSHTASIDTDTRTVVLDMPHTEEVDSVNLLMHSCIERTWLRFKDIKEMSLMNGQFYKNEYGQTRYKIGMPIEFACLDTLFSDSLFTENFDVAPEIVALYNEMREVASVCSEKSKKPYINFEAGNIVIVNAPESLQSKFNDCKTSNIVYNILLAVTLGVTERSQCVQEAIELYDTTGMISELVASRNTTMPGIWSWNNTTVTGEVLDLIFSNRKDSGLLFSYNETTLADIRKCISRSLGIAEDDIIFCSSAATIADVNDCPVPVYTLSDVSSWADSLPECISNDKVKLLALVGPIGATTRMSKTLTSAIDSWSFFTVTFEASIS